jgi:hypothetical protein
MSHFVFAFESELKPPVNPMRITKKVPAAVSLDRLTPGRLKRRSKKGDRVSPVVRQKDPLDADPEVTTVRLGRKLLAEIDAIATASELSRNKVVADLLKAGLQLHRAEQKSGEK